MGNAKPLDSFELDGVRFILDLRDGKDRGTSEDNEFVLVKPRSFIDFYRGLHLILDLLINVPNSPHLKSATIHQDIVVVEKSLSPPETDIDLGEGYTRLRGRTLGGL